MKVLALNGSPRRNGNTSKLLGQAVQGVKDGDGFVDEITLRDNIISPCLELYGCKKTGRCIIQDDFQYIYDKIDSCDAIIVASPIFFYTVSSHTKILIDRCQSFWVKKNWLNPAPVKEKKIQRKGLFLAVGATKGKKLFDGALLTMRYFFEAIDTEMWGKLLVRGVDFIGDVEKSPGALQSAYDLGVALSRELRKSE